MPDIRKHHLTNSALTLVHAAIISSLVILPAYSDEISKDSSFNPAFSIQAGSNATEIKLGLGNWDTPTNYGQIYVSHFRSEDDYSINGISNTSSLKLSKQEYTSTRIGFDLDMFNPESAGKGGLYLYSNESQLNIDRYGIGLALTVGKMLTGKARIQAGIDIMPEFLSTDWDADALFEYEFNTGATYRITNTIDATINYRRGATFDDVSVTHYAQVMAGIALKL